MELISISVMRPSPDTMHFLNWLLHKRQVSKRLQHNMHVHTKGLRLSYPGFHSFVCSQGFVLRHQPSDVFQTSLFAAALTFDPSSTRSARRFIPPNVTPFDILEHMRRAQSGCRSRLDVLFIGRPLLHLALTDSKIPHLDSSVDPIKKILRSWNATQENTLFL